MTRRISLVLFTVLASGCVTQLTAIPGPGAGNMPAQPGAVPAQAGPAAAPTPAAPTPVTPVANSAVPAATIVTTLPDGRKAVSADGPAYDPKSGILKLTIDLPPAVMAQLQQSFGTTSVRQSGSGSGFTTSAAPVSALIPLLSSQLSNIVSQTVGLLSLVSNTVVYAIPQQVVGYPITTAFNVAVPIHVGPFTLAQAASTLTPASDACGTPNAPAAKFGLKLVNSTGRVLGSGNYDLNNLSSIPHLNSTSTADDLLKAALPQSAIDGMCTDDQKEAYRKAVQNLSTVIDSVLNSSSTQSITDSDRVKQTTTWLAKAIAQNVPANQLDSFIATQSQQQAASNGGGGGGGGGPTLDPNQFKVVFQSNKGGNYEIYAMYGDGSNQTKLTSTGGVNKVPVWSPTATAKIAWVGDNNLWVMNQDGSSQTKLTTSNDVDPAQAPSWKRDGSKIAFVRTVGGVKQIYVIKPDGTGLTQLTAAAGNSTAPKYSPAAANAGKIAYVKDTQTANANDVFVMDDVDAAPADNQGDNDSNLTGSVRDDLFPNWSPDGATLVFRSFRNGVANTATEIYSCLAADGSGLVRLTNDAVNDDGPAFNVDGTKVGFMEFDGAQNQMSIVNANGTGKTMLTSFGAGGTFLAGFSSDGTKYYFNYFPGGVNPEIWSMKLDGTSQTKLTTSGAWSNDFFSVR